jgi:TolB-like protein
MGYIADGFTEELTAQLSKANEKHLSVIARTTAMCYKGANKSVAAIGAEMGVDYVLESSVRTHHGIYRLTAQLIRVSDQSHVWSESVQGDRGNPIEAQVALSDQIVRALTTYLFPAKLPSFLATMYQAEEAPRSFRHSGRFRRYRTRVISIPKVTSRLVHRWFDPTKRRFKAKVRLLR